MKSIQKSKWISLLIVSSAMFLAVIDIFIVNVAIPAIQKGINGTEGDIQLVIALYLLGYAAFLITAGKIGDRYGRKRVFVTAMFVFTLSSLLCGISQTALQLNTARFLQGVSAAFMIPQSIAYIQFYFPEQRERIKAMGIFGSIAGAASVIGQFLGGVLPDTDWIIAGWRLIFLINLPIGLIAVMLAWRKLEDTPRQITGSFDYMGVTLLTSALICLIYPLIRGRELGWPLWSLFGLGASVILLIVFIFNQRKGTIAGVDRLINMQLFAFTDFNLSLCAVLFYFLVQDTYFLINALLFQNGFGMSSSETGVFFVAQGAGYVSASLFAIRLIPVYGKKVLQTGVVIMLISLVFHVLFFRSADISRWIIYPVLFIYGTGCGSVLPSLMTMALRGIPVHLSGAAAGTFSTFQQTAIALGIGLVGGVFFYCLNGEVSTQAYVYAYDITTVLNVISLLLVSFFLYLLPGDVATQD
ncbi:MFS transporter [Pedobacter antarcticus 4BY]|uniref:MFS transporter n=2 Tax=Pedobacter antarcticus TaxID=34086 RepID=A0A081PCT7_9SPHI|nr:MFS transporter [Pedobacter antarcticus]KEQ28510.1 MFS transporter [Pedobacter antarcticus 4BY]SFF02367.1 Major Facilitator Superfamily protein [Pedobacter antarcticus]